MSKLGPDKLEELKTKHGKRLWIVTVDSDEYAVVMPSRDEWKRFMRLHGDEETKPDAFEGISLACVVWPEGFETQIDERPGLAMAVGNKISEIAGLSKRVDAKKA